MPALRVINGTGNEKWVHYLSGTGTEADPFRGLETPQMAHLVASGDVPGHTALRKFGLTPVVASGDVPLDIWDGGILYPWSATADIVSISSGNAGDAQQIQVTGLDAAGAEVTQTVTLNGQTRVALTTALLRVWRMKNLGATDNAGVIYCFSGTAVTAGVPSGASVTKAMIAIGNNQTLMAIYTIPLGKVGFLHRLEWGLGNAGKDGYATCYLRARPSGGVFQVKKAASVNLNGSSNYEDERPFPDVFPALTDLRLSVETLSDAANVLHGTFDMVLVEEEYLPAALLTSIAQPSAV